MFSVLVLNDPLAKGSCEGSERERCPSPLFALLAVIFTEFESGTAAPKSLVKFPVELVWLILSPHAAKKV
jgi:hypothetical protein